MIHIDASRKEEVSLNPHVVMFPLTAVKTQLEDLDMGSSATLTHINDFVLQTVL